MLKMLGLVGRVESLEALRAEIADLRGSLAMSERQCKIDRLDLRETIKALRNENAMDHDTLNIRMDRIE